MSPRFTRHSLRLAILVATLATLGACSSDRTPAPVEPAPLADEALRADVTSVATAVGLLAAPPGATVDGVALDRLPAELRLTDDQRARIDALLRAFATATRADVEAVAAIVKRAEAAMRAGKPAAEVRAIMAESNAARARLDAAARALQADIAAVLTREQRAWIDAQRANRCERGSAVQLSGEQVARIHALLEAFETAHRADLEALAGIAREVQAARQAGKSDAELRAILARSTPIRDRLAAAEAKLRADIDAVLTPEQRASGCPVALPAPRGG
ncbi:Spy/CpxP family protein refolding chaperone [Roseisolibacter agri]|uniref:Lipoprotein n=1 Tax=Roseisolibacter agri TaxID=2014610 RepID=A0AA37V0I2_9BACT|nr:Spy/CpxP family protein refolding chaperone [Roseisolibacter agri]GLC24550.1 hypothetical protein rosag_10630 [Roseisolibacter agri]